MTEKEKDMAVMGALSDAPDNQLESEPLEGARLEGTAWVPKVSYAYWYDGCPEHVERELNKKYDNRPLRTVIMALSRLGPPDRLLFDDEQWVRVYSQQLGPERECPYNQTDIDDPPWVRDEVVKHLVKCPLCDKDRKSVKADGGEHDLLYVGEEWQEVTYCNEQTQTMRWALTEIATAAGDLDLADQGAAKAVNTAKARRRVRGAVRVLEDYNPQDEVHNAERERLLRALRGDFGWYQGDPPASVAFLRQAFNTASTFLSWDEIAPRYDEFDAKETLAAHFGAIEARAGAKAEAEAREKFNIEAAKSHSTPRERMARVAEALSDVRTEGGRYTSSASGGDAAVRSRLLAEELEPKPRNERRRIAEMANEVAKASTRRGGPPLGETSSMSDLLRWLRWNDPNGEYESAEAQRKEGLRDDGIETVDEAWDLVKDVVNDVEPEESDAAARGRLLELNPRRRVPTPPSPAAMIEDLVRKAVIKVFKITPAQAARSIQSSFTTQGTTAGKRDPFKVVVYSEHQDVPDPYHYNLTREYDQVVKEIKKDKLAVADAGWDSYNGAVQYFWIEPRLVS